MPDKQDDGQIRIRGLTVTQPINSAESSDHTKVMNQNSAAVVGEICATGTADASLARIGDLTMVYGMVLANPDDDPPGTPPFGDGNLKSTTPTGSGATRDWKFLAACHNSLPGAKCGNTTTPVEAQLNTAAFWFLYESVFGATYYGPHTVLFTGMQDPKTGCEARVDQKASNLQAIKLDIVQPVDCTDPERAKSSVRIDANGNVYSRGRVKRRIRNEQNKEWYLTAVYARLLKTSDFTKPIPDKAPGDAMKVEPYKTSGGSGSKTTGYFEIPSIEGAVLSAANKKRSIMVFWFQYEGINLPTKHFRTVVQFRGAGGTTTEDPEGN